MFADTSPNKSAYLSEIAGLSVSLSICVRKIMNESIPMVNSTVTAIGIDDWAFRKGGNYGTIIVDLTTGKVIDLIKSRDEEDVKHWLEMHPHVELITRDRYAVYRNAATKALPGAKQVADRFHLMTDKVYEIIQLSYKDILKLTECQTATSNPLPENIPISNPMLMADLRIQRPAPSSERQEIFSKLRNFIKMTFLCEAC